MIKMKPEARADYDTAAASVRLVADWPLRLLSHGFTISWFRGVQPKIWHAVMKPDDAIQQRFSLRREYFVIGHGFDNDFHQRTLLADPPRDQDVAERVDPRIRFVASSAPQLTSSCAAWSASKSMSIVPVQIRRDDEPSEDLLLEILRQTLWARDWFEDSDPVSTSEEFFGRERSVNELVGKIELGKPAVVLGLRRIGKSSLLRRAELMAPMSSEALVVSAFLACNGTNFRAGRWWTVLGALIDQWKESLTSLAKAASSEKFSVPAVRKLANLVTEAKHLADDARVANAFRSDLEKLLAATRGLARLLGKSEARLVAFLDEADELSPLRKDPSHWLHDFFLLWDTLTTIRKTLSAPAELNYILGGVNPSFVEEGAIFDRPNPLFELKPTYLQPMDATDSKLLLNGIGARMGLTFDDPAIERAHSITGGHPWLLRKLGSLVHEASLDRPAAKQVGRADIDRIYSRGRRGFYAHMDWILRHLQQLAADEYALLRDLAVSGEAAFHGTWQRVESRDVLADHLEKYGIVDLAGDAPRIRIELVTEALRRPLTAEFESQKKELRVLAENLEGAIRYRIVNDLGRDVDLREAVDRITDAVPSGATGRPLDRRQLKTLGMNSGLTSLVQALNWDDMLLVLEKNDLSILWSGPETAPATRLEGMRQATRNAHLARHSNDAGLKERISETGFASVRESLLAALDLVSA